jgi:uncharacterized protein
VHEVLQLIRRPFRPNKVVALRDLSTPGSNLEKLLPLLAGKTALREVTTFICQNFTCTAPLVGAQALRQALS